MKKIQNKIIQTVLFTLGLIFLVSCGGNSAKGTLDTNTIETSSSDANTSTSTPSLVDTTAPIFTSSTSLVVTENERKTFILFATDANEVSYAISGVDASSFSIDASTGKVSLRELPNYEKKSTYAFTATATDSRGNASTQEISVRVVDVEESLGKFVMSVNTSVTGGAGESSAVEFVVPTNTVGFPDGYNYSVDCDNDGLNEATEVRGNYTCEYNIEGLYSIAIEGNFPQIYFNQEGDKNKITSIDQWGNNEWKAMNKSFRGCTNLAGQATDSPNLGAVRSMDTMFNGASSFDQNISAWDVSNIIYMDGMFAGASSFNQDIGAWNVSNVVSMSSMFAGASSFNQDISSWNVLKVTSMRFMFKDANAFDQNIGAWQPYSVTRMDAMFEGVTLSPANYKLLLVGWAFKKSNLRGGVHFSAGNSKIPSTLLLGRVLPDIEARNARNELLDGIDGPQWTITDGD